MRIALLCSVRDEAPYIVDWIAYHQSIGVTDFVFFQNDSVDGTDDLLAALAAEGVIQYFDNTDPQAAPRARKQPAQRRAYIWAMTLDAVKNADFVCPLDIDEFIDVPDTTLPDFVGRMDADAVSLPWRLFGSGCQQHFEPQPVWERFTHAAEPSQQGATRAFTQVKTLFRPEMAETVNLHLPRLPKSARWVTADGADFRAVMRGDNWLDSPDFAQGHLRHYHVKSMAEFCVKMVRGFASHAEGAVPQLCIPMFQEMDQNTVAAPLPADRQEAAASIAAELRRRPRIQTAEAQSLARFQKLISLATQAVAAHPELRTGTYKNRSSFDSFFNASVFKKMGKSTP